MKKALDEYLLKSEISLRNALANEVILAKLLRYGITKEALETGLLLIKVILDFLAKQQQQNSDKLEGTKLGNELFKDAFEIYHDYVKLARDCFNNNDAIVTLLDLNGLRKKSLSGFILQSELFYANILNNENILNGFKKFSITKEDIKEASLKVTELKISEAEKHKDKEDLKELTKTVDSKIDDFYSFMETYQTVAKIALKNNKDLLNLVLVTKSN